MHYIGTSFSYRSPTCSDTVLHMPVNPDTTSRLMVSLPRELADRVKEFARSEGVSVSIAIRTLIQQGLSTNETSDDVFTQLCQASNGGSDTAALDAALSFKRHPLVTSISFEPGRVLMRLKGSHLFAFDAAEKQWTARDMTEEDVVIARMTEDAIAERRREKPADPSSGFLRPIDFVKDPNITPEGFVHTEGNPPRQKLPKPPKKL